MYNDKNSKKPSKFREKFLLFQLKNRNADAFTEVYDYYVEKIYRFIYFKVSGPETAEDLTSEVFLRLWRYFGQPDCQLESLNALIYKTARNLVIDFYRQQARENLISREDNQETLMQVADKQQENLLEKLEIKREMAEIEKYLNKLKEEYREIIILRFLEELSVSEISKILEKSKGATRVLVHRALKNLKELLKENERANN